MRTKFTGSTYGCLSLTSSVHNSSLSANFSNKILIGELIRINDIIYIVFAAFEQINIGTLFTVMVHHSNM